MYQIWRNYLDLWGHDCKKWVWPTFGCKLGQSDPIVMQLKLNMSCQQQNVYTKIQIDISKHVEEKSGKHGGRTDGHCHGIIRPFFKRAYKNTAQHSSAKSTKRSYGNRHIWGSRPHPVSFICSIWYYRSYHTAARTARVGNPRCYTGLVQILFGPAETIRCYQWYTIIISNSVFWTAWGICNWPSIIHPVHNTATQQHRTQ